MKKAYNPEGMHPTGNRYSHVVRTSAKSYLFIAGQVALDAENRLVGKGDFRAQAEEVFKNLKIALEAEGASYRDVVKLNIYVTDMGNRPILNEVREKYFKESPPASTLVGVTSLAQPDFLLEIEAIAALES